ncbi:MAG: ComEC/Rec2 family competence protein [Armatimonadota bacterium]
MIRQITARPFVCLLIGVLIGLNLPFAPWIFALGVVIATLYRFRWLAWLSFGLVASGVFLLWQSQVSVSPGPFDGSVRLTGFAEYRQGQTQVPFRGGVLKLPGQVAVAAGELWTVSGTVTEAKSGVLRAISYKRSVSSPLSFIGSFRVWAIDRINLLYGERDGPWVNALTFNFASELEKGDKAALVQSGTYHLVSASGLHVWVLALFAHFLLVSVGVKRHWQIALIACLLLGYCLLTGFHPPTVRSSLMWLVTSCAYLVKRSPDGLSAISLAGVLWLAVAPQDVFSPSFQLSYVVTAALTIWFDRRREFAEWWRGLEVSCVASFAAEPLGAWWFGRIVLIGPVTNILVELASSVVVVLGFVSVIPFVGELVVLFCRPLLWWMQWITALTAQFPSIVLAPRGFSPMLLVGYYCLLLMVLWGRPWRSAPKSSASKKLEP